MVKVRDANVIRFVCDKDISQTIFDDEIVSCYGKGILSNTQMAQTGWPGLHLAQTKLAVPNLP